MSPADKSARALFARLSLMLIALALVFALIVAARYGIADVYAEPAKTYLQYKRDEGDVLSEIEFQAIRKSLIESLRFAPNNPLTLSELGRLHRIQLESDTLSPAEIERHGNLAIEFYEQAAIVRPTWPWGWGSLAQVRYELYQDTSYAYQQALIRSTRFGPWEGKVQRLVTRLGIDTWESLRPGARLAVLDTIDRAIKRQPDGLSYILDSAEGWQTVCRAATPSLAIDPARQSALRRLRGHCEGVTY